MAAVVLVPIIEEAVVVTEVVIETELLTVAELEIAEVGEIAATLPELEIEASVAEVETSTISAEIEEVATSEIEAEVEAELEEQLVEKIPKTGVSRVTAKTIGKWLLRCGEAYMVIDFIGRKIASLFSSSEEKPLTDKEKDLLHKLSNCSEHLKEVYQSWQEALKPLENVDLGILTVDGLGKKASALVTDIIESLLARSKKELDNLKTALDKADNAAVINILKNGLLKVVLPLEAICQMKTSGKASVLQLYKFPPEDDCREMESILKEAFNIDERREALTKIQSVLNETVKEKAKKAGIDAAAGMLQPDVVTAVKEKIKTKYGATAKKIGTDAASKAAKSTANGYLPELIAMMAFPLVGLISIWPLKAAIKKACKEAAKQAAKNAVSEYLNSNKMRNDIKVIIKKEVADAYKQNDKEINRVVKEAVDAVFKDALANAS